MEQLSAPVTEFANYLRVIRNRSALTVEQYKTDLMLFSKYIIASRKGISLDGDEFDEIAVDNLSVDFYSGISTEEIYEFFNFTINVRANNARTRARKLSTLKAFYKYLTFTKRYFENNPVSNIDSPSIRPSLPKYLTVNESIDLLDSVKEYADYKYRERDFAIITLFLNCGIRLSELVGINLNDIDGELRSMRVIGKGAKERVVYLNSACKEALTAWLSVRKNTEGIIDRNALFLSSRKTRISRNMVQRIVYKYLKCAGLEYKHFSVHKLRHTAATLMYQTGKVDVRVLKDILGHEQLNTTQIYTHVSDAGMENAMNENPLAKQHNKGK